MKKVVKECIEKITAILLHYNFKSMKKNKKINMKSMIINEINSEITKRICRKINENKTKTSN